MAATRQYRLGRRADQQAQTRQRIVEAAVDLHTTVGPAATSISAIAERAGVQRHTVYAHFPDETVLFGMVRVTQVWAHRLSSDLGHATAWRCFCSEPAS